MKRLVSSILGIFGCLSPLVLAETPQAVVARHFDGLDACVIIAEQESGELVLRHGGARCALRLSPCSTFKVPHALIALETGVAANERAVIPWDGVAHSRAVLNQDHTLSSAVSDSVVWYFRETARRIGEERMSAFIEALGYGNEDLSGGIDRFWLESSLRISADEQLAFLQRLYAGTLPFEARHQETVRRILVLREGESHAFAGKTGSGNSNARSIGWFIGRAEHGARAWFVVANVRGQSGPYGYHVRDRLAAALVELGWLPPE